MSFDPASSTTTSAPVPPAPAPVDLARGFFAAAPGCILLVDPDTGTIREANAACAAFTGYLRGELAGMTLHGLTAPEDRRDRAAGALDRVRELGEPLRMDVRYQRKDGRTAWGAMAMTPLAGDDGRIGAVVVQIDDLTERKRSDADRRLADLRFRRLVEEIPAAVFALPLEPGAPVSYLSPRIADLTGHAADDLVGSRRFLEPFVHPDDLPAVHARLDEAARTLEPYAVRFRVQRADGDWTWLDERGMVVRDELGVPRYWQGILLDASAEMAGREALADSEALFRSTFEHGAIGMAVVDAEGRIVDANPALCAMLGRDRDGMSGLSWRELSAPDSIAANAALFDELRRGERDTYVLEKEYLRPDGSTFRGVLSVSAVRDARGRLVRAVSQVEDVTAEREAVAALADSETFFRTFFENARIGMATGTPDARLIEVNPAFCALVGATREELVGRSFLEFTHPDDAPENARRYAAMAAGETDGFRLEKRYLRSDGSVVWVRVNLAAIRRADGTMERTIALVEDISDVKAAQGALAESEALFRSTFENAAVGMGIVDADGRTLEVNPAFCRMLGSTREELMRLGFADFTHPEDLPAELALLEGLRSGERDSYRTEKRYVRKDGGIAWGRLSVSAVRGPGGEVRRYVGQVEDVTAEKAAVEALSESEALFRASFEDAAIGMGLTSADGRMLDANPALCRMLGYPRDELLAMDFTQFTHPDDLPRERAEIARMAAGEIDRFQIEKRYIRKDGAVIWVNVNGSCVRGPDGGIGLAIGQVEDITARKVAEAALAESEAWFRSVFEDAAIGMTIADEDGRFLAANPAFGAMLGRAPEDIVGLSYRDITHPDDLDPSAEAAARMNAGELDRYQVEKRYLHRDGHSVWCRLNVSCVREPDGRIRRKISQVEDITARRAAEAALAESEALFRSTFEAVGIGMVLMSPDGVFLDVNPALCRIFGYEPADLIGHSGQEFMHPDDLALDQPDIARMRAGEIDIYGREKRFRHKDGRWIWSRASTSCLRDADGQITLGVGIVEDITARKEAEQALSESEARFRSVFEDAPIGMALADPQGRLTDANLAFCRLLGHSRDELRTMGFAAFTHPDDLGREMAEVARIHAGEIDRYRLEKRYVRKDGSVVWVNFTGSAVRRPDGEFLLGIGQVEDITAVREAQAALAASEAHLREIFENAATGIVSFDPAGRILETNPALRRMLGHTDDELRAMTGMDLMYPEDVPAALAAFRRLADGEIDHAVIEFRVLRRDGGIAWLRANSVCVRGPKGDLERILAQVEDISAVRLAQQALADSEQRFRALVERSTDTMVIADAGGTLRWASPAMMGLLGRAPEDVVGLPRYVLLHPDDRAVADGRFAELLATPGASARVEVRLAHVDGSWRWVEIIGANHLDNPAVAGLVYNIRDISARKEAERAVAEALDTQRRANDALVALGQQRSEFLAMLAHDFRTPLTSIQGYSELLKLEAGGNPDIVAEADVIHDSAVRLNRMVEDMLLVETLEKRLGQLDLAPTALDRLVRDAVDAATGAAPGRVVTVDLPPGLPEVVVDRDQVTRAIVNLVSNALKYSPDGSPVRVTARLAGDRLELAVSDSGFGIPADRLETIFEKYGRVRTSETEGISGVGLGLPIVRAIARAHGGDAWAESERGVGSTFWLALPLGA